jgi:hypothetical protein
MKLSFKKFNIGHAALALMGLTILACGGGSGDGGTDRILTRNFYAVNASYSENPLKFNVASQDIETTGAGVFALSRGKISGSRATFVNKQLDPIPYVIKNATTDATLVSGNQQVTSSDRHFVVAFGPESATKALIIPLEPILGTKVVFDAAQMDSSETRALDLYLLSAGQTLATASPTFTGLKYDPLTPQFMVQQKIMEMGGSYTLKVVPTGTKTEIAEYTQPVTLKDKFFNLFIFTKDSAGRDQLLLEQKRAPG